LCCQINANGGLFGCINVDEQRLEVHRGSLFNVLQKIKDTGSPLAGRAMAITPRLFRG
jgi:hypothetical protein